jgi:G:T-mismatch repair DNA endonuclease (very short patch repair protein)
LKKIKKKPKYSSLSKNKKTGVITRTHRETSIEKEIRLLLQSSRIPFLQEFHLKNKYYDFLIFDYIDDDIQVPIGLIEVNGDYFHARDYIVEQSQQYTKLTRVQKRNVQNDKRKRALAQDHKMPLLYIWEKEIKEDMKQVKKKLLAFIEENYGKIPNQP